jgi:cytochrome P450
VTTTIDKQLTRFFQADQELIANPFNLYRDLRQTGPVYLWQDRALVTHYDACRQVLNAPQTMQGLSIRGSRYREIISQLGEEDVRRLVELFEVWEKRISGANGEQHRRLRRLAQRAFTPRVVSQMDAQVQATIDKILNSLRGQDEIEFIGQFIYHVPLIVVLEMYDLPTDDREKIRDWASAVGRFIGADLSDTDTIRQTYASVFELRHYLSEFFDRKRGSQTTELMRALLDTEGDEQDKFAENDLISVLTQMVVAGHETTTHLVSNSVATLLSDHRDQWELLCAKPELIPGAVEELLRYCGPAQFVEKLTGEVDTSIAGVDVGALSTVSVFLGAANRDEAIFDRADTLDITRTPKGHLAFGFGPHHCLGAALARMEAIAVLRTFTERFPDMAIAPGAKVTYHANRAHRGVARLPVRLGRER